MIGRRMSDKLLESQTLKFYQWEGDVKVSTSTYIYVNEIIMRIMKYVIFY